MFTSRSLGQNRFQVCTTSPLDDSGGWSNDALAPRKGAGLLELLGDPSFDVTESIPEVSTCFEAGRALSPVPPCVEGSYRHVQIDRELSHCQQSIESIFFTPPGEREDVLRTEVEHRAAQWRAAENIPQLVRLCLPDLTIS